AACTQRRARLRHANPGGGPPSSAVGAPRIVQSQHHSRPRIQGANSAKPLSPCKLVRPAVASAYSRQSDLHDLPTLSRPILCGRRTRRPLFVGGARMVREGHAAAQIYDCTEKYILIGWDRPCEVLY